MSKLSRFGKRFRRTLAGIMIASMFLSMDAVVPAAQAFEDEQEAGIQDEDLSLEYPREDADDIVFEDDFVEEQDVEVNALEEEILADEEEEIVDEAPVESAGDSEISGTIYPGGSTSSENKVSTQDNGVSGNEVEGNTCELINPQNLKAVINKTHDVKLTWKKVKGAKLYSIFRMKADGTADMSTPIYRGKKCSFIDREADWSTAQTLAYKVMAENASTELGHASYTVASPIITDVKRTTESDTQIAVDVCFTTVKGATGYGIYRAGSKRSRYDLTMSVSANKLTKQLPYQGGGKVRSKNGLDIEQEKVTDSDDIRELRTYFYKVRASYQIAGGELIESEDSAVLSGRVTTRAPKLMSVSANSGTSVTVVWEDMEAATDADGNKLIKSGDYYQLYMAQGKKGKFKKIDKIKASSNKLGSEKVIVSYNKVSLTAEEAKEQNLGTIAGVYTVPDVKQCVTYELEDLKPMVDYTIKVAVIKQKVEGSHSDALKARTELEDIKNFKIKNTDLTTATLNWDEVEGATAYNVYYAEISEKAFKEKNFENQSYRKVKVKVTADKDGVCEYVKTKLASFEYYVFYVEPLYEKNAHNAGKNTIYAAAKTRIAAPDIEVKQSSYNATNNTLTFTWPKIAKATGYIASYYVGSNELDILDSKYAYREELKKDRTSFKVTGVNMGVPVAIRITTLYEKSNVSSEDAIGNSYEAIEYACPKEPEVTDLLYNGINLGADIRLKHRTAAPNGFVRGYQVWRSAKKNKDYVLIAEFTNSDLQYKDNLQLRDGKKAYYRVYDIIKGTAANGSSPDWKAVSRDYTQEEFCCPTSVEDEDITVGIDESKSYELTFKPKATTMKQVRSWEVSDDKTDTFTKGLTEKNEFVKITTSDYNKSVGDYLSPKITIKGLKKGTCYIQALLANGMIATIKVKVTDKSGSSSSKDDDEEGKKGKGKTICLDPGHGGNDGGCASGSLKESELTLKISDYTRGYLEEAGFKVVMTREKDKSVDLEDRVKIAKNAGAVAIISQHINSGKANGVECYYSVDGTGKSLASKMCSKTAKATGMNNRGAKTKESTSYPGKDYYAIIRYARSSDNGGAIAGLIMENGFIQADADYLDSDKDLKKIAKANAEAIIAYYGD